jgi:type I restriction enzyme, S subunit
MIEVVVPFESLYLEPSRNGLNKPKRVRGEGAKMVNMGEIFAHNRLFCIPMDRVPMTEKEIQTSLLSKGDLLFARQSLVLEGAGKCAIFIDDDEPVTFESHIIRVRLNPETACAHFYYYYFRSPQGRGNMFSIVEQGAGASGIRGSDLAVLRVPSTNIGDQKAIAEVLGALDDKIELNRQMNETLEEMARVIFKDWFVDFGPTRAKMEGREPYLEPDLWSLFPDRMDEETGLPEGWTKRPVIDLAERCHKSVKPQNAPEESFEHYSLPAYDSDQEPTMERGEAIKSNKTLVLDGAVLLSKLNPRIPRVWLPRPKIGLQQICSTEFLTWVCKPPATRAFLYGLFTSPSFLSHLQGMVTGTSGSHQRVIPGAVDVMNVTWATDGISEGFDALVTPLLNKIQYNRDENQTLAKMRDALLPKLMSGEIRVRATEKEVEAVV